MKDEEGNGEWVKGKTSGRSISPSHLPLSLSPLPSSSSIPHPFVGLTHNQSQPRLPNLRPCGAGAIPGTRII
jgi:hypothetical protein